MEKLGIANADLLKELKDEYLKLRAKEASLAKEGHVQPSTQAEIARVKARINELENQDGGSSSG